MEIEHIDAMWIKINKSNIEIPKDWPPIRNFIKPILLNLINKKKNEKNKTKK